ncbi:unnamed protein product [Closterium sp. NIES-54]
MNCLCLETFLLLRIRLLLLRLSPNLSPSLCLSLPSPSLPRFLEIQNLEPGVRETHSREKVATGLSTRRVKV